MIFSVDFDNSALGHIPEGQIESFSFICSIFNMYTGVKLLIKDYSKDHFNLIKSGMPVTITFKDGDGMVKTAESYGNCYINKMKVFSFEKQTETESNFTDYLDLTLISDFYYKNAVNTAMYEGNISTIISNIISKNFSKEVKHFNFSASDDLSRRRYQIAEKDQDFMLRLLKYGIKEKYPVYLYSDAKGTLNLQGIKDLITKEPNYVAMPMLADQTIQVPNQEGRLSKLNFFDYQMNYSGKQACSEINNIFNTVNFRSNTPFVNSFLVKSTELNNNQVAEVSPKKTVFYNWNKAPNDAMSIAAKRSFEETIGTYSLTATFKSFAINELALGSTVYIILPFSPTAKSSTGQDVNLGEGKYLITQVEYIYENRMLMTRATMVQVAN